MRIIVIALLLLATHFSLIPFAPAETGKNTIIWPIAANSRPWLSGIGGLPQQPGSVVTTLLAGGAGLCLIGAVLALFGVVIPAAWWPVLVTTGSAASMLVYVLYFGPLALIPIALDMALLWGVFIQKWTVTGLSGA